MGKGLYSTKSLVKGKRIEANPDQWQKGLKQIPDQWEKDWSKSLINGKRIEANPCPMAKGLKQISDRWQSAWGRSLTQNVRWYPFCTLLSVDGTPLQERTVTKCAKFAKRWPRAASDMSRYVLPSYCIATFAGREATKTTRKWDTIF